VVAGAALSAVVGPLVAVVLVSVVVAVPRLRARSIRRREARLLVAGLPDVVDLLALAVGAGASTHHAVEAVARHGSGPLARELASVVDAVDRRGARLADGLAALPARLGEPVGPVVRPLVASLRYGTPLGPTLALVGHDLRLLRRHQAEERLRRIPVRLLFPLVCCTLPAFVLLTVVPLLAGALGQLS
jgi:tight adherence protein C